MVFKLSAFKPSRGQLAFVVITFAALYVILPQIGIFRDSLNHLSGANWRYLVLALIFMASVNLFAALNYYLLAKHKLKYFRTLLIMLAGNFVNRLLPAGIGSMGINYAYLKANKHSNAQSASVVAVNNLLGGLGNTLLIAIIFLTFRSDFGHLNTDGFHVPSNWKIIVIAIVVVVIIIALSRFGHKISHGVVVFFNQVLEYRKRPLKLALALASSILLTLSNVLCLYYSGLALNVHLGIATMLVVMTIGTAFGTATPTPGGIGGIDAALVVALVAYSVPVTTALAVTLLFRLISCWLPVVIGIGALYIAEHRNYFNSRSKILA